MVFGQCYRFNPKFTDHFISIVLPISKIEKLDRLMGANVAQLRRLYEISNESGFIFWGLFLDFPMNPYCPFPRSIT